MTLTIQWWWIPLAVTVIAFFWASRQDAGHFGIGAAFAGFMAMIVALLSWVVSMGIRLIWK